MSRKLVVGVDFGTLSGRALVVDAATGEELGTAVHEYANGVIDERLPGSKKPLEHDSAYQDPRDYLEVLATAGNNRLGGDDYDQRVMDWLADGFRKDQGIDLRSDKMAMQRLKEAAEKAKIELSGVTSTSINLPYITADATGPKHLDVTLTRAKFDELTADLVEKCVGPTRQALQDAGLSPDKVEKILLVGGSTRTPAVQDAVQKIFAKEPFKGINPDECVAVGAAIQAAVLTGDVKGLLLLDVTPLSLGIETLGGVFTRIIDRNTTIPTKKSQVFSTAADGQTQVEVHVLQGEREMAQYNKTLGKFQLDGIPPAPRGVPQVEVTFDIDANGIAHVTAKDLGTGREQHITITASTNLNEADIQKAVKDAEQFAAEDKRKREEVDTRNAADSAVYQVEKAMKDLGDKISAEDKTKAQAAVDKLKASIAANSVDAMKADTEALHATFNDIAAKVYQQNPGAGPQGPGPGADAGTQDGGAEGGFKDAGGDAR